MSPALRGWSIVAVIVIIGIVIAYSQPDEIDRFLDDRRSGEYAAEFRSGFMSECQTEANVGLRVWRDSPDRQVRRAAEQITFQTIQSYCGCAYDVALPRFTEADLRAANEDRITDHARQVQDEAIDRCTYIIEAAIGY